VRDERLWCHSPLYTTVVVSYSRELCSHRRRRRDSTRQLRRVGVGGVHWLKAQMLYTEIVFRQGAVGPWYHYIQPDPFDVFRKFVLAKTGFTCKHGTGSQLERKGPTNDMRICWALGLYFYFYLQKTTEILSVRYIFELKFHQNPFSTGALHPDPTGELTTLPTDSLWGTPHHHKIFRASSYGGKGGLVRRWLLWSALVMRERLWCSSVIS